MNEDRLFSYHAEMVALYKVPGKGMREKRAFLRSARAIMIIIRVKKHTPGLYESFPCPYCYSRLEKLGITVYYSTEEMINLDTLKPKYRERRGK